MGIVVIIIHFRTGWGLADLDLSSYFVGLPDKIDARLSDCLPMPLKIQVIPLRATDLGAYATPKTNTLKSLFLVMFRLIFPASKA